MQISGITINDDPSTGVLQIGSTTADVLKDLGTLGSIEFDVKSTATPQAFAFGLTASAADVNYEARTKGVVVSPDHRHPAVRRRRRDAGHAHAPGRTGAGFGRT